LDRKRQRQGISGAKDARDGGGGGGGLKMATLDLASRNGRGVAISNTKTSLNGCGTHNSKRLTKYALMNTVAATQCPG
jgi:hypothetical protein